MPQIKQQNIVGLFVLGFVGIIVGLNLLVPIANQITAGSILTTITNETVTLTGGQATLKNTVNSLSFFGNASTVDTGIASLAVGTGVNFTSGSKAITTAQNLNISVGALFYNTTFSNGSYNATYTNKGANYVDNPTAQTIDTLVIIFLALSIIIVGLVVVLEGFKAAGFSF